MTMRKLTSIYKFPCNFQCNSPQRADWDIATPETHSHIFGVMRIAILDCGDIYVNRPKHITGCINTKVSGGKWERLNDRIIFHHGGTEVYLSKIKAVDCDFRGGPRVSK